MRASTSIGGAGFSLDGASAPDAVNAEELVTRTIATREELERWVNEQKSRLLAAKRDHEVASQDHARVMTEAQRKREQLQLEHRETSAHTHDQESQVTAQQVEIEVLQAEKAKKEPVLRELFAANQQKDEQLKHLVRESEQQRASWGHQLAELQRGLDMYARLGLVFEQTNAEKIVIRFTQIDSADPQREFSFLIRIDAAADTFIADACEPPVDALPQLMEELNATADFSKLVRAMRREFKKLVQ